MRRVTPLSARLKHAAARHPGDDELAHMAFEVEMLEVEIERAVRAEATEWKAVRYAFLALSIVSLIAVGLSIASH